jgi:hypothetical protein
MLFDIILRFHALQFVGDDGPVRARRCRDRAAQRRLDKFVSHCLVRLTRQKARRLWPQFWGWSLGLMASAALLVGLFPSAPF